MEQKTANAPSFQELIQSSTPVLVDFYADWCGPCKAMNPVIQDVARTVQGTVRVIKVNIDKSDSAASAFNVNAVPTFILFRNGKQVWRHSGMIDKQNLLRVIQASSQSGTAGNQAG
jgi:thioredoxin 1